MLALERLTASGQREAIFDRHAAWCLALARSSEDQLRQVAWLDRIAQDGWTEVDEITTANETITFSLPKNLRADLKAKTEKREADRVVANFNRKRS